MTIKRDLDDFVAGRMQSLAGKHLQIQAHFDELPTWIQRDLDDTVAWIQEDLKRLDSHIQRHLEVPVDKVQHDLYETSIEIQRDLQDWFAQWDLDFIQDETAADSQSDWEEETWQTHSELGMNPTAPHCDDSMALENFVLHKVLGRGYFGKVMLAEFKGSGVYFSIKALNKGKVLAHGIQYLMSEKSVLTLAAGSPFLGHLYFTFQTSDTLFFVMEYLNGGDLFFHKEQIGCFDLISTQFYAAEMICGLQFLHRNGVIYRDLKPENVMLDRDGHIKIVDFGLSKLNMLGDERAKTFCGTPHYIAPEIILGQQYFSPVDWWSFGVLLFEMLTDLRPFHGANKKEVYVSVCMDIPKYPNWINQESKDIMEKLLEKDPNHRLGTFGNIREHPFFESIDWAKLERREMEPPFKPELTNPKDCRYFDEELLNETPKVSWGDSRNIGPMDQSAFADFSSMNPRFFSPFYLQSGDYG
ncbi:protein kinase C delta type-like [Conger conger]|uniref:protein kinase C delta type-like n=1 Tax=Conger conger TaxID=82655 RepID=UPI002A5A06BE|nr:protein kinase C delta type-like [Conger conger]